MKFLLVLTITIFCCKSSFSQVILGDSLSRKIMVDSFALNKKDSLPYATLYFYRSYLPKMKASVLKIPIYINDSLVHKLKANNIISLKVNKEGKFKIAVDDKGDTEMIVKVKFGKEYFLKCEVLGGFLNTKITIDAVTPAEG